MFRKLMQTFVKWLDPKLDKYRPKIQTKTIQPYTPQTLEDFVKLIQRTPKSIFSSADRVRLAAIMDLRSQTVGDLMTPKSQMITVQKDEVLGPLVLDKLYKSGLTDFPVIDNKEKIIGILHTDSLNSLETKTTNCAGKYLDKNIHYLHTTDSINHATNQIIHQNTLYFLVLDKHDTLVGFFSLKMLLNYLNLL